MDPKSDAAPGGFNARAEMPGFGGERPRTFCSMLRAGNNVESAFYTMKERFGGVARALKPHTRAVELPSMSICYNMTTWPSREG